MGEIRYESAPTRKPCGQYSLEPLSADMAATGDYDYAYRRLNDHPVEFIAIER